MRVSAKSDYALRALIEMAGRADGRAASAEELGRLQDIPHGFLQAILADLRRAGVVMSQRGQSGGWRMGRSASEGSFGEVSEEVSLQQLADPGRRAAVTRRTADEDAWKAH